MTGDRRPEMKRWGMFKRKRGHPLTHVKCQLVLCALSGEIMAHGCSLVLGRDTYFTQHIIAQQHIAFAQLNDDGFVLIFQRSGGRVEILERYPAADRQLTL